LQRSTLAHGVAQWISSQQDYHARRSLSQASNSAQKTSASSGLWHDASLFSLDRRSYSWRTSAALFDMPMGSGHGLPTLPASGSMRSGRLFARPMSERRMSESGSSRWPTADANSATYSNGARGMNLREAASQWATQNAQNMNDGESLESFERRKQKNLAKHMNGNGMGTPLAVQVRQRSTPAARDWKDGQDPDVHGRHSDSLGLQAHKMTGASGAALSPYFVETLMGLRDGWTVPTVCVVSATPSYPSAPNSPSQNSRGGSHERRSS
jgi:hypothetical protein